MLRHDELGAPLPPSGECTDEPTDRASADGARSDGGARSPRVPAEGAAAAAVATSPRSPRSPRSPGARAGALARGHSAAVRACLRLSLAIDARLGGTEEHSPGLIERAAFTLLLMSVELTLSVATLGRSKQPVPILE